MVWTVTIIMWRFEKINKMVGCHFFSGLSNSLTKVLCTSLNLFWLSYWFDMPRKVASWSNVWISLAYIFQGYDTPLKETHPLIPLWLTSLPVYKCSGCPSPPDACQSRWPKNVHSPSARDMSEAFPDSSYSGAMLAGSSSCSNVQSISRKTP